MRGQKPFFSKIGNFSYLQVDIFKTINRIEMKPSSSCSTYNSEQNDILFRHLGQVFMMYSTPEGNSATLTGKINRGQTWRKALIDI